MSELDNVFQMALAMWGTDMFYNTWGEYEDGREELLAPEVVFEMFIEYLQDEVLNSVQRFIRDNCAPESVAMSDDEVQEEMPSESEPEPNLAIAERCYSPISPYPCHKCEFCDLWFNEREEMEVHARTHPRESVLVMRSPQPQPVRPTIVENLGSEIVEVHEELDIGQQVEVRTSVPSHPEELFQRSGNLLFEEPLDCNICHRRYEAGEGIHCCRIEIIPSDDEAVENNEPSPPRSNSSDSTNRGTTCSPDLSDSMAAYASHMDTDSSNESEVEEKPKPTPSSGKVEEKSKKKRLRMKSKKQIKCPECSRILKSNSQLITHMRVHSGEKPFECDLCGKKFSQKGHITAHLSVHTKKKEFPCDSCDKSYKHLSTLNTHQLKKHVYDE